MGFTLEVDDLNIAFNINSEVQKMFAKIFLDFRLIKHCRFHAMTPGTLIHFKKQQNTFFSFFPGLVQFFLKITPGFMKKVHIGITPNRGMRHTCERQQTKAND